MRLSAQNVTCVRGGREIFAGLSFAMSRGEALAVTGVNGAGKSSLLRLLAGLLPCADGVVTLDGGNPDLTLAEQTHYLGHRDPFKPALTARENLEFWKDYLGGDPAQVTDALTVAGLDHAADLPAAFLSTGQKRRLSLARLLAIRRPVWLLDEPLAALDTGAQASVNAIMAEHLAGGGLIIAATHGPLGIPAAQLRLGEAS